MSDDEVTRREMLYGIAGSTPLVVLDGNSADSGVGQTASRLDDTEAQSILAVDSIELLSTTTAPSTDGELRNVEGDVHVATGGTTKSLSNVGSAGASGTSGQAAVASSGYLDADGSDEADSLRRLIEDAASSGPTRIRWDSGTVTVDSTVTPSTDGTKVVIEGEGNATIDGSGVSGAILDCSAAPNLHGRHLKIEGSPGNWDYSLVSGEDSTWEHMVFDGGSGAIEAAARCRFVDIEVVDQRDTENGYAQCFHAGGAGCNHWVLRDFEFRDSDRGVEIDDGPSHWLVENGRIDNIDNADASTPGEPFALDCHVHPGSSQITDGTFRDVFVSNSARGLTVSEHADGLVHDVTAESVRTENIGGDTAMLLEGDVELVRPTVVQPNSGATTGIAVRGGRVRITGGTVHGGVDWYGLRITEGSRTALNDVVVEDLTIDGEDETNHCIELGSVPETARLSGCTARSARYTAVRAESDSLGGSGWGAIVTDCLLDGDLNITDSGNTKCLIRGGRVTGSSTTPADSVVQHVA